MINVKSEKGSGISELIMYSLCFVLFILMVVTALEYFIPVSKYGSMKEVCRDTLYSMEISGGLISSDKERLNTSLEELGLEDITITGTTSAKQGDDVLLHVEASYTYSRMINFLSRNDSTMRFVYDRTLCSRKAVN